MRKDCCRTQLLENICRQSIYCRTNYLALPFIIFLCISTVLDTKFARCKKLDFYFTEKTVQHLSTQLATASAEKDSELEKALKNEKAHMAELEGKNEELLAQLKELKISFDKTKTEMKVLLKHDQVYVY